MLPRALGMNRRDFLGGLLGAAAVSSVPLSAHAFGALPSAHNVFVPCQFPKDFLWGVATASYQIEGAWNVSTRIRSMPSSARVSPSITSRLIAEG